MVRPTGIIVLVVPYWNVNEDKIPKKIKTLTVLVVPYWNVNKLFKYEQIKQ